MYYHFFHLLPHSTPQQTQTDTYTATWWLSPNIWMQAFFDTQRKDRWLQSTLFLLLCHIKNLHLSFVALFSVLVALWKLISPSFFKWRIIAFPCCFVSSCCTVMWISYKYTYILSLLILPPTSPSQLPAAAAAAAKSLQSCPTLSDPMDWSLPGSSIRGVLEWGAIAFSVQTA